MENREGVPTNVVYGVTKLIGSIGKKRPDYVVFAFDSPGDTFRHEIYSEYKANREEAPPEFKSQIPLVFRLLEINRIPILAQEGYEADDIIATVVTHIQENHPDMNIYVESKDKDLYQLLTSTTSLADISSGSLFTPEDLKDKWGISPSQVKDFLTLTGDSSDNIPGIPGIGPKTASSLLAEYGTIDEILQNIESIKGKKKEAIIQNKPNLELAEKLVSLHSHVPVDISLDTFRRKNPDAAELFEFYSSLDFESLLQTIDMPADIQGDTDVSYTLVSSPSELSTLITAIEDTGLCSLDLETTGLDPITDRITGISFSATEGTGYFIPFPQSGVSTPLSDSGHMEALRRIIEDPSIHKVGQNIKYDIKFLLRNGFAPSGYIFDTMIAAYLLNPGNSGSYSLSTLSRQLLGYRMTELDEIAEKDDEGSLDLENIDMQKLSDYACEDADITLRLYTILRKKIEENSFTNLLQNIEVPSARILARMELNGVYADTAVLEKISATIEKELATLTQEIYSCAEETFNINSPQQLSVILFEKLGLPYGKKTKTGYSTNETELVRLSHLHPLPATVLEVRHLTKLKNTYIDVLPGMVHPETGRIHPQFNQVVTATGRLSSSNPNLQNIPIRREKGRTIREAFKAQRENHVLLAADYSQIELRMLAHFSGDASLTTSFREDRDIHAVTASLLNSVPPEEVTPQMRYQAKAVNFGILYGQGPYGLSRTAGISHKEAKTFIDTYFEQFSGIKAFIDTVLADARESGEVRTILNRRRKIPELASPDKRTQKAGERIAVNTVIQGSAADLIKKAMVDIHGALEQAGTAAMFILQIHDELVFELPENEISTVSETVRGKMENAMELSVPLKVHIEHGKTWKETK